MTTTMKTMNIENEYVTDLYGEVINDKKNYQLIAQALEDRPVIIGWTDEEFTHKEFRVHKEEFKNFLEDQKI